MREKLIELVKQGYNKYFNPNWAVDFFAMIADNLIANDVVPVVRCKDCKHCMLCYPEKQIGKEATPGWYCKDQKKYSRPDDYCSYGERRTDV